MITDDGPVLLSEGGALLLRLFDIAVARLQELGISAQYTPSLLEWLLNKPDWRTTLNPLRSLDGCWHRNVGSAIEGLLLNGNLRRGDSLLIGLEETSTGRQVHFEVTEGNGR